MKRSFAIIVALLFLGLFLHLPIPVQAKQAPAFEASTALAWQQHARYLERSAGDLKNALAAYDRAMQLAEAAGDQDLVRQLLLDQQACQQVAGQKQAAGRTLARLGQLSSQDVGRFGVARFLPPEYDFVIQLDLARLVNSPLGLFVNEKSLIHFHDDRPDHPGDDLMPVVAELNRKLLKSGRVALGLSLSRLSREDKESPKLAMIFQADEDLGELAPLFTAFLDLASMEHYPASVAGVQALCSNDRFGILEKKPITFCLAQPDAKTVLAADRGSLAQILETMQGQAPGLQANARLREVVGRLPQDTMAWIAAAPNQFLKAVLEAEGQVEFMKNLPDISGVLLSARGHTELAIEGLAWTGDRKSAEALADLVRGGIAMARIASFREPELLRLLEAVQIEVGEQELKVLATLPGEFLKSPSFMKLQVEMDQEGTHEAKKKTPAK